MARLPAIEHFLQRLAGKRPLAPDDSFERLGGDSLSYVRFSRIVERALGVLPPNWPSLTVEDFRRLTPERRPRPPKALGVMVESDIPLRCFAILLVLAAHALGGPLSGGADILMVLAGYTWSRFQQHRLVQGRSLHVFGDFAARYLLLYLAIMIGVFVLNRTVTWPHLLFYGAYVHDGSTPLDDYWFMESLAWIAAFTCLLFAAPQVRAYVRARPSGSALAFVALALAIRTIGMQVIDPAVSAYRTPDQMLVYFAAGWAVFRCTRSTRFGLMVVLCAVSALAWGWRDGHFATMALAAIPLVFMPRLWLPRPIDRLVALIAGASFYIYLLGLFPHPGLDAALDASLGAYRAGEIILSLAVGIGGYLIAERIGSLVAARRADRTTPA